MKANRLDQALPLYEQNLAAFKAKLGADHFETLIAMSNLAHLYKDANKIDQALSLASQLEKRKDSLGPDHPHTVTIMNTLGLVYLKAKQPEKALPLLHQFLAAKEKRLGSDSLELTGIRLEIAIEMLDVGWASEAEPILRDCLAIGLQKVPDQWGTFVIQSQLGHSLLDQKKHADAEPLLLAGYEGLKQCDSKIPLKGLAQTEALERLVRLYDGWGKKDEAEKWRKELAIYMETQQKNDEPNKQP